MLHSNTDFTRSINLGVSTDMNVTKLTNAKDKALVIKEKVCIY